MRVAAAAAAGVEAAVVAGERTTMPDLDGPSVFGRHVELSEAGQRQD